MFSCIFCQLVLIRSGNRCSAAVSMPRMRSAASSIRPVRTPNGNVFGLIRFNRNHNFAILRVGCDWKTLSMLRLHPKPYPPPPCKLNPRPCAGVVATHVSSSLLACRSPSRTAGTTSLTVLNPNPNR